MWWPGPGPPAHRQEPQGRPEPGFHGRDASQPYGELEKIYQRLEKHFKDMQDIEFTVQQGKLWMLQTRSGKRTAFAALRIAVEMVGEKLIDKKTAISRVDPDSLNQLLAPIFNPQAKAEAIKAGKFLPKG